MVPPMSPPSAFGVLFATIVFLMKVVSLAPAPALSGQVFPANVLLLMFRVPSALRIPPPLRRHELPLNVLLSTYIVPPAVLSTPPAKARSHSLPPHPNPATLPENVLFLIVIMLSLSTPPTSYLDVL